MWIPILLVLLDMIRCPVDTSRGGKTDTNRMYTSNCKLHSKGLFEPVSVKLLKVNFVYRKTPQSTLKLLFLGFDFVLPNVPDQNSKTAQHAEDKPRGRLRSNCSPSTY